MFSTEPVGPCASTAGGPALLLACTGTFLVIMDATIVSVALPAIRTALAFSSTSLPWVVNAYTLTFAGLLLLGGRLADLVGRRRIFVVGMAIFTGARLAAGLSSSAGTLLGARAVQGIGGALLVPVTLSMISTGFADPIRRARALGTWSAVGALGAAVGPVIGGLLTAWAGWRAVFVVTVPIGVAAVAAAVLLPVDTTGPPPRSAARLDVTGAVTATVGLALLVYGVMQAGVAGWASATVAAPVVAGVVVLVGFVVHQQRWAAEPLMPPSLFRARSVSSGNAVMLLLGLGFFASPVLLSLYWQDVHRYSPLGAGLAYLPVGVAMFVGAQGAGRLSVRLGVRWASAGCCALGAVGLAGVAWASGAAAGPWIVMAAGVVFGFGCAAAFTPTTIAATDGVPAQHNGVAAGVLNTVRQTSGAIGLAALSAVTAATSRSWLVAHPLATSREAIDAGYTCAFAVSACCLVAAAVVAVIAVPRRSISRPATGADPESGARPVVETR